MVETKKGNQILNQDIFNSIVTYMFNDIREDLHNELAPCSMETFLIEYVKRDPEFNDLLHNEFGLEVHENTILRLW